MKYSFVIVLLMMNVLRAQEAPAVQVISRSLSEKVLLRWAVDEPSAWKKANEYGFLIERSTISRNGEAVIPIEKKVLVSAPLKPAPLEAWEALATKEQNAAILAQALYGDSFETSVPGSAMGSIYAVNDELEQRFTFALLAAEQNYEAAKLAGWAFEDATVKQGERYLYSIAVAVPQEMAFDIESGSVYASPDLYEELPKPIGVTPNFGDGYVTLNWNFDLLKGIYTSYHVERSNDAISFEQLNGVPIFSAQESNNTKEISLSYTDSIPNKMTYYYRIKGKNAFGETGPSSEVVSGMAEQKLEYAPRIYKKEIPTDDEVVLFWDFDPKGNDFISGFEVRRSTGNKGPFETVKSAIKAIDRETRIMGLKRVNYYTVVAMGKNGMESESFPTLVQPIDSTPPAPPFGLKGVMDTTGIIKLEWTKNLEEDLGGYRIFRSNNPKLEFSEVTQTVLKGESYTDTIQVNNLNREVYYKIRAEDQRYNRSKFSEVLTVEKPDVTPPSPPVFKNYLVTESGIQLNWIPSSSEDVVAHAIYRKRGDDKEALWEQLMTTNKISDSTYLDTSIEQRDVYNYTMVAKDGGNLESIPTESLSVVWQGKSLDREDLKFSGMVDRELRFINLSWRVKNQEVLEYRLYRGKGEAGLKLYKTLEGTAKGYNDVDLEINTNYTYGLQLVLSGGRTSMIQKVNLKY
ncbi:fibronectin type III domain-containing protein [Sediminicola sp. 1XM1-17]|uniref:fibronectin type III domain-containing protein n=1 Tax=Sediminicola sp. 1XM1-17 TaxID=3127702 RepID=UPI003076ACD1